MDIGSEVVDTQKDGGQKLEFRALEHVSSSRRPTPDLYTGHQS